MYACSIHVLITESICPFYMYLLFYCVKYLYLFFRLTGNIIKSKDPDKPCSLKLTDIVVKYNEEKHANIKSHVLGRLIKKIYPEARKFYPLDKNTDKQVTGYKGICFSSSDKENRNLDLVFSLQDVSSHLPKTTVQLPSEVDGEVNIAVFSKMYL